MPGMEPGHPTHRSLDLLAAGAVDLVAPAPVDVDIDKTGSDHNVAEMDDRQGPTGGTPHPTRRTTPSSTTTKPSWSNSVGVATAEAHKTKLVT